jgi:hypothetical protein
MFSDITFIYQCYCAVDPLCWAAPPTRRELLIGPTSSTSDPASINQPEMSDRVDLDQPEASEPPARYPKMRTLKELSSSIPLGEQSGGHFIDIDHVPL